MSYSPLVSFRWTSDARHASGCLRQVKTAEAPKPPPPPVEPAPKYKKGQIVRAGLSAEDVLEYNKAQGDPMQKIDLKTALAGDSVLEDKSKGKLFADFDTTMGKFRCELYEDQSPNTVANFVGLARGVRPYYVKKDDKWITGPYFNGALFHRVIDKFMIQTGDPLGGPGGFGTGGCVIVLPPWAAPISWLTWFDRLALRLMFSLL